MRELTKQQKIKVIDKMIVVLNQDKFTILLCSAYRRACDSLKYKACADFLVWTPRFRELNKAIKSEIKRTGGSMCIHYGNQIGGRINLLKKVKKEL